MRTAGLPVLPHQEQALARAGADLDRLRPHGAQDLRGALTVRPELASDTDRITATLTRLVAEREARQRPEPEATAARLVTAMEREKEQRQDPAVRVERYLARWTALERSYEDGDWKERTRAKAEMKALAQELKRDAPAEAVLKSRARGAIGEADASLPVQVWSVQSLASRTGASLAGVAATRRSKRRQRLDGVWDRLPKEACCGG